jgi:hypothetical protein
MIVGFIDQLLPVLAVEGALLVELFTDGGDAEIGPRLAKEVRLLRLLHGRDMWSLGKTLAASAGVTVMAAFPRRKRRLTNDPALLISNGEAEEIMRRVYGGWYLSPEEALSRALVADLRASRQRLFFLFLPGLYPGIAERGPG